jgi:chromosomal replication initiator protein
MRVQTFPIEFLRKLESNYKVNIENEFRKFELENPWTKKLTINAAMQEQIRLACEELNVSISELIGKSRKREIAVLRQYLMDVFYVKYPVSLKSIGNQFGGRDHSTVINARSTISDLTETNDVLLAYYKSKLSHILN